MNSNIDGILGLGANIKNGPSFVNSMQQAGIIDDAILSFSLGYKS